LRVVYITTGGDEGRQRAFKKIITAIKMTIPIKPIANNAYKAVKKTDLFVSHRTVDLRNDVKIF
jgi:hypothetical protein